MTGRWLIVFRKEMKDNVRDRRSLVTILLLTLLGPALFAMLVKEIPSNNSKPPRTLVVGGQNAPNLITSLQQAGVETVAAPADYEAQIREGQELVAIVISKNYPDDFSAGRPAEIKIVSDGASQKGPAAAQWLRNRLTQFGGKIGSLRLIARGVDPSLETPLKVEDVDVSSLQKRAGQLLSLMIQFLTMAVCFGGMYAAIDALAGERERNSLEPLLLTPATPREVVLGKWLAVVALSLASLLVVTGGFFEVIRRTHFEQFGLKVSFDGLTALTLLLIFIPSAALWGALQLLTSTFARSFREAQSYVQVMQFAPIMLSALLPLSPFAPARWMSTVPFLGQALIAKQVINGEGLRLDWYLPSLPSTLCIAAIALWVTMRLLRKERIIFGR